MSKLIEITDLFKFYGLPIPFCLKANNEVFDNPDFECGSKYWELNDYTGTLVDNDDGTVTITAEADNPDYFALQQTNKMPLQSGMYQASFIVNDLDNIAKFSYHYTGGTWYDALNESAIGEYSHIFEVTAEIDKVNVGHHNAVAGNYITFDRISLIKLDETRTPCMTGYETPYGKVEASAEFSTSYRAYEGINCANANQNCWVTPVWENAVTPDPTAGNVWFQWYLRDEDITAGMPLMFPTELSIYPRASMTSSWYSDNNPYKLRIVGLKSDMSEEILIDYWYDNNWTGSGSRTWDLTGLSSERMRGFKVYILGTRNYDNGSNFHSGWGNLVMKGAY